MTPGPARAPLGALGRFLSQHLFLELGKPLRGGFGTQVCMLN